MKFLFTGLNDIKVDMIKEANQNAKKAAQQFAQDTNVQLGDIHSITQSTISISDTYIPIRKNVRVISYAKYYIKKKNNAYSSNF